MSWVTMPGGIQRWVGEPFPEPSDAELAPLRDVAEMHPCGTNAAYQRHIANKEPVDQACVEARRAYSREYMRRIRAAKSDRAAA